MADIADIVWPDNFPYLAPRGFVEQPDGSWRLRNLPYSSFSSSAPTPIGWADGHGLQWKSTPASNDAQFTIQSGYTVMVWRIGPRWEQVNGQWQITGSLLAWQWWHATPQMLDADQPGVTAQGSLELNIPLLADGLTLRVRRAGPVAVSEYIDAAGVWQHLFTSADLSGFLAGPDGWYIYVYDVYLDSLFSYIRGFTVAASRLYQCQPDGTLALVGTADRPFAQTLPDGTVRVWPGAEQPLYQCQPDGTLAKVIG